MVAMSPLHLGIGVGVILEQPVPPPAKTHTCGHGYMSEDTQFPQNLPLNTLYTSPLTAVCNLPHFPEVPVHHPKPAHTRTHSPLVTYGHP